MHIQGGSIKPLLRFGGRFFRIGVRFEYNSKMMVMYVILTVYGKNSITNSAYVAKISIFPKNLVIIHFVHKGIHGTNRA